MDELFVIFYRDVNTEKTHTEYLAANTLKFAMEQFHQILQVKGIQYYFIIRVTQYLKVGIIKI
jgi:hypothetical protein